MFFNKCIKMVGENNIFIKIPGLFRTEYMFVGEKKDSALDFEGRFIKSCELFETGNLKYKNLLEKDDEPDFSIFVISCWNDQTKEGLTVEPTTSGSTEYTINLGDIICGDY